MIQMESLVTVADNTGARSAKMIGVLGKRSRTAQVGDIITAHIRDSIPTASVKKGSVVKAVVVRTKAAVLMSLLLGAVATFVFVYFPTRFANQAMTAMRERAASVAAVWGSLLISNWAPQPGEAQATMSN